MLNFFVNVNGINTLSSLKGYTRNNKNILIYLEQHVL